MTPGSEPWPATPAGLPAPQRAEPCRMSMNECDFLVAKTLKRPSVAIGGKPGISHADLARNVLENLDTGQDLREGKVFQYR